MRNGDLLAEEKTDLRTAADFIPPVLFGEALAGHAAAMRLLIRDACAPGRASDAQRDAERRVELLRRADAMAADLVGTLSAGQHRWRRG